MSHDEAPRLTALHALRILDTPNEAIFDSLTLLAANTFKAPIALISLVDANRQWFKSCIGLDVRQTGRDVAFCDHAIRRDEPLVILDATADPRFRDNPLVTGPPDIRFYAGAPLIMPTGERLGTLCIIDTQVRAAFGAKARKQLRDMAATVVQCMLLRGHIADQRDSDRVRKRRQANLAQSAEMAQVGAWSWDVAGGEAQWSPTAYRLHDMDPDAPLPTFHQLLKSYDPDDAVAFDRAVRLALKTGAAFELTARLHLTDGSLRHMMVRGAADRDENEQVTGLFGTYVDVTAAKLADEALREREARLRFMTENASDLIVRQGPGGVVREVIASQRVLGYGPDEMVGMSGLDLIHPDDKARGIAAAISNFQGEVDKTLSRQFRFRAKSGAYVWLEGNPTLLRDHTGAVTEVISVFRDVTAAKQAEERLQDREARLRFILDHSSDVIIRQANGVIIDSSLGNGFLGYGPGEVIGVRAVDMIHPDDLERLAAIRKNNHSGEIDTSIAREYRVRAKSGEYVWIEGKPTVVRDADGAVMEIVSVLRDISERRQSSEALRSSEERYRLIAENITDVVARSKPNGTLEFVSPSVRRVLGYSPEFLVGKSAAMIVHPDDLPMVQAALAAYLAEGPGAMPPRIEYRALHYDGRVVWVEACPQAEWDEGGKLIALQDCLRDISDRMAAEAALAVSESRYRLLAENSTDIIGCYGADGLFTFMSQSVESVLGYAPVDLVGHKATTFMHPDDVRPILEKLAAYAMAGPGATPIRFSYRALRKDGSVVWLEAHPKAIFDDAGVLVEFQDTVRDISERVAIEAELAAARDAAEAAAAAKSTFLANISHEIRTPLTAIIGFSSLVAEAPDLDASVRRHVDRISAGGQALLALVNDVLDFSKLEAGQMEISPRPVALAQLADDTLAMFTPQSDAKGLELRLELPEAMPEYLTLDPDRVRQVLLNLIGNAVKFTDHGRVSLVVAYDSSRGRLSLSVRDTGSGLDAEQRGRLFKRFSQVDDSVTRRHGGTGLGLAICRSLADAMGGDIGVDSEPGEGSTFWIELPAPISEAPPAAAASSQPAPIEGSRVLVVDDNPVNRELARSIMEPFEIEVTEAESGEAALELAAYTPFDVILMDIRMPGLDGPQTLARLRAGAGPNQDIPVLAFSADADLAGARIAGGFDGAVRKPIRPVELLTELARCTGQMDAAEPMEDIHVASM